MRSQAKTLIPQLLQLLDNEDSNVPTATTKALGNIEEEKLNTQQILQILNRYRTYAGKLKNPVSRRYLCVKNNDLLSKPGLFA